MAGLLRDDSKQEVDLVPLSGYFCLEILDCSTVVKSAFVGRDLVPQLLFLGFVFAGSELFAQGLDFVVDAALQRFVW